MINRRSHMITAGLALVLAAGVFAAAACSHRRNGAGNGFGKRGDEKQVITFHQALESVWPHVQRAGPGDLSVWLDGTRYKAVFAFVTAADRRSDHVIGFMLNAETGEVAGKDDKGAVPALHGRSAGDGWQQFLSAQQAYQIALKALDDFEEYDHKGKLTVELKADVYYVTFPLLKTPDTGPLQADYAMQVQIDARSGKVRQVLGAS